MNVSEEQDIGIFILRRNPWLKLLEVVQFGKVGFGFVEVLKILSAPAKSLARRVFDSARVYAPVLENVFVLSGEVLADNSNHANVGKVTCCQREISCRPA